MDWSRLAPFLILDASFLVGGMAGWLIGMFFPRYSPAKSMRLSLACALVGSICALIQGVVFWNHPMLQSYGAWQIPVLDFRGLEVLTVVLSKG